MEQHTKDTPPTVPQEERLLSGDQKEDVEEVTTEADTGNTEDRASDTLSKDEGVKDSDNLEESNKDDDKEGSSDSQSEPFEIVQVKDNENSETGGQEVNAEADSSEGDEYVDILGNGLLRKKVLQKGQGRESRPLHSDLVTINIEGKLESGATVDKQDSLSFVLGDGDVIQALDLGVSLMELGEQCELITAAKYAYGELGREPDVPSNATITYQIELVNAEGSPNIGSLTVQERIAKGEVKRERGNYLFTRKDYTGAIGSYSKAITMLEHTGGSSGSDTSVLQGLLDCKIKCYNNLAACQLKIDAFDAAIRSCEGVLKSQPENVKALYRIGKAYGSKGENEEALVYLRKALKLDPSSKILHAEMAKLSQKLKKETDTEKQMYRRMMGTQKDSPKETGSNKQWWKLPLMFGGVLAGVASVGLAIAYRYAQH